MTDEEIKLNAEEYGNTRKYTLDELNNSILTVEEVVRLSFIAGAHSRDEEIKHLEEQLERTACDMIAYKAQVEQLCNLWISVKNRLPEKTKGVFSCEVRELERDKIVYYKDTRGYIHTGYLNATNHWRDLDRDNTAIHTVTHWMPIPEI